MNVKIIQEMLNSLIKLTESGKIKSFQFKNETVDLTNIKHYKDILNTKDILYKEISVSNKYIGYFKDFDFNYIQYILSHKNNFNIILPNGKYITFNATKHCIEQLFKRAIYIWIKNDKFEFSVKMKKWYNEYLDYMVSELQTNNDLLTLENIKVIETIFKDCQIWDVKSAGRWRDRLSFKKRDKNAKSTNRYFNHPFMFIVQNSVLKTVELYSSSQDCRHLNKFTSSPTFYKWLDKKFGND